ncbi:MAG: ubiquitin [Firmicutes bacterium HGW-Firmicutes-11]|jgi:hypothetical protein|nr:MAG: ubiquitin [Firmicutes bacterium HGW-Firmicutes-11]
MEITLEKIELVKDRTGVSYKEAKEALESSNGSVVDAIISIEESIDVKAKSKIGEQSAMVVDKIKSAVRKGNVSKVIVRKGDEVMLNLPVSVSIIGSVLAPWAAVAGIIAVFGTKCTIELVKDNGEVIDISEIATDTFEDVVEKGSEIANEVKDKGSDVFDSVKTKATDAINKATKKDVEDCDCGDDEECKERCGCKEEDKE